MKKKNLFIISMFCFAILAFSFYGCQKDASTTPQAQQGVTNSSTATGARGISSAITAYYDSATFTILFEQFSDHAAATLIAHNPGINFIYQSDNGLPNNQPFISVIDAIPGDGMNPVWEEVQIVFNNGYTPHQLYSDNEVLAASTSGEINLTMTGEVYWCPVIGHH
jgi:hypothetical protein